MTTPTPDEAYEKVWKPLIEKDGQTDYDVIKRLLFDYGYLLSTTSYLYGYLTESNIDDPQAPVEAVIEYNDNFTAATIDDGIRTVLNELLDQFERTSAEDPETRLNALVASISSIYESGAPDASS